jgi:eukaryotic-like serine/threonine-protein kinase
MLQPGTVLQNRYRIIKPLGEGGMGAVYHAWDNRLNIPVALKEMFAQPGLSAENLAQLQQQFRQEATILARLDHPHLVGVTDFFQEGEKSYLVMKFVEGDSLANRINRQGALPEVQVLEWAEQLLDALSYCHSRGIIHRDIKPQNIIVRSDGQAVLVDFGLVKLWDPNDPRTQTAMRGMGTPQYAPPEQYGAVTGHTEPRSDLYALGATLYHALSGDAPPTATLRIAAPEEFAPLRTIASGVSRQTSEAIERSLELPRSKRWDSAAAMADGLERSITDWEARRRKSSTGEIAAEKGGTRILTGRVDAGARRRMPLWGWGLIAIVLLSLVGSGVAFGPQLLAAISSPTLTPTPSPTLTSAPTFTVTPTETATPSPTATEGVEPTSTPKGGEDEEDGDGDETETPTATPSPSPTPKSEATETPTPENGATSTPASQTTASNALVTFEQWGAWRRGDQSYGELSQSSAQAKTGSYSAQLTYNFPAVEDDYVVFSQPRGIGGQPNYFAAWVYGDGSRHYLNLWIQDAAGEIWAVHLGRVGSAGWRQMGGYLAPGLEWPAGHISGPDNGVVDYPVKFYALVLDRPSGGTSRGTIYIDDITAGRGSVPPTAEPITPPSTEEPTEAPTNPPSGDIGRIIFTVQIGKEYRLYSTDPAWSQMQEIGLTDYNHSTCAGGSTASTLDGRVVSLYGVSKCNVTHRTDVCTSPDGQWKLVTNFIEDAGHSVTMESASDPSAGNFIYQGSLNRAVGVGWSPNSQVAFFGVASTLNGVRPGADSYFQLTGFIDDNWPPQFSPDGSLLYYLKPVGYEGASDIYVVNPDGTGERNLTNAPIAHKLCPRWRR